MSLPPRGSVSGTVLVVVCVVICHTEAQPLDTMRRICILQGNSSRDQIHVLPMFKTVEDRLRFQLEAFEVRNELVIIRLASGGMSESWMICGAAFSVVCESRNRTERSQGTLYGDGRDRCSRKAVLPDAGESEGRKSTSFHNH
eukprot:gb/GECG01015272.1/.p1 GENE.gb/GECG01015272.1/~~gb/GECG01015272.1/.p1  ORF type:complete len:143 (+),score=6.65 gb/GECG01015272.1/:1-429(+)